MYANIVNQYTIDDNEDYTTEPVVVSDTESDHVIVMDKVTTIGLGGSVEDIDGTFSLQFVCGIFSSSS